MSEKIGLLSYTPSTGEQEGKRPYSKHLAAVIDIEARTLISQAFRVTEEILIKNKDKLNLVSFHIYEIINT